MTSVTTDRRQGVSASAAVKVACKAGTTGNITLSGEQTIDGVAVVTNDRVLVKDQTDGIENGIYDVDTSTWTRSPDWDGAIDVVEGTIVPINNGTINSGNMYKVSTSGTIIPGTTSISFAAATTAAAGQYYPEIPGETGVTDTSYKYGDIRRFGAVVDGATVDDTAWTNAVASGKRIFVPNGTTITTQDIDITVDETVIEFESTDAIISTSTANVSIIHLSADNCQILNFGKLVGNSTSGVTGLRITPADETQIITVVNQNYNKAFVHVQGCDEGVVLMAGPDVAGTDSGCWYNEIHGRFTNNVRNIWLKNPTNTTGSPCNRNTFYSTLCQDIGGARANTGVQIDAGDTNRFFGANFESMANGTSPNTTPTAVKIANQSSGGADNNDNIFFGAIFEANTRDIDNSNPRTQFYGHTATHSKCLFTAFPDVMIGTDASAMPLRNDAFIYQDDSLEPTAVAQAMYLPNGRIQFPATQNASANANVLDDYDEDVFPPELWDSGLATKDATYTSQVGRYTKVGRVVHFQLYISVNSLGTLTAGDSAVIGALPFTAVNETSAFSSVSVGSASSLAIVAGIAVSGIIVPNTKYIQLKKWDAATGTTNVLISEISAGGTLSISGSYEATS